MIAGGNVTTQNANTPSINTTAGTALAANSARLGWSIQNVGTNPVYVCLGPSASSTVFHYVLKGGTGAADGLGGSVSFTSGVIYNGLVTFAGTTPSITVLEIAP